MGRAREIEKEMNYRGNSFTRRHTLLVDTLVRSYNVQ